MRKIKWGVIGTAFICERSTFPGMLLAENCEMYAVAGRSMEKAEQFRQKYGFVKAYDSYEALLEDAAVEAVYIALPNTLHYEWTLRALKHGKHVLCEKPIAPTAAETEEMFRTAREQGVFLMEAFAYQHSPYVAALRSEIESGMIGDVLYMDSTFLTSDYGLENIRMRRETNGGALYDLGVYSASLILRMMGREPESIRAIASFSEQGVDQLTSVIMEYAGGARASFTCGMLLATGRDQHVDRFSIHGTKGSITGHHFEFNGDGTLSYIVRLYDGTQQTKSVEVPQNYRLEVEQLGRCILNGEKPAVSEAFSLANSRTIDRILKEIGY